MRFDLRSNKGAELGTSGLGSIRQLEVLSNSGLLGVLEGDGGESLDVEVGAFGAGLDELSGEREDSAGAKSSVERSGDCLSPGSDTDECLMTSLNGRDGGSGGKDVGGVDQGSSTEVGRDTDGLEDTGGSNHGLRIRERGVEVVLAGLDGLCSGSGNGAYKRRYVNSLGLSNVGERLDLALGEA